MSAAGTGELQFTEGTMNANMYCDILKQCMIPSLQRLCRRAVFQNDKVGAISNNSHHLRDKLTLSLLKGFILCKEGQTVIQKHRLLQSVTNVEGALPPYIYTLGTQGYKLTDCNFPLMAALLSVRKHIVKVDVAECSTVKRKYLLWIPCLLLSFFALLLLVVRH